MPKYFALVIAFEHTHIASAISHITQMFHDKLLWNVQIIALPSTSSQEAQLELEASIQPFLSQITHPDDKTIVLYGGYSFVTKGNKWMMSPTPKEASALCQTHILPVDSSSLLWNFTHLAQDILFISQYKPLTKPMVSGFATLPYISFNNPPAHRPDRIVAVLNLPVQMLRTRSKTCDVEGCTSATPLHEPERKSGEYLEYLAVGVQAVFGDGGSGNLVDLVQELGPGFRSK